MKKPKSFLLSSLLKNLHEAIFSENNPEYDFDEIQKLKKDFHESRRKFISDSSKAAVYIGLGSLIPLEGCFNSNDKKISAEKAESIPKIVIVGAGIAGLYCAYLLKKAGYVSQIYEADKRVGGRIFTQTDVFGNGLTTEFGGEYIDSIHTVMLEICNEFNLDCYDFKMDRDINDLIKETYFFHDKRYTEEEIFNGCKKFAKKIQRDRDDCGDFTTDRAVELDKISLEKYIQDLNGDKWIKEILITSYTAEYGAEASEQSSLNFISMISNSSEGNVNIFGESDERFKIAGGNQKIIEALHSKLENQVMTGHKLTAVKSTGQTNTLTFNDTIEVQADKVVLAIPFTVLRKIKLEIDGISEKKLACINELGYGQNNKILLGYNSRPWREGKLKYSGYMFNQKIQNGWDNSGMQTGNKGPGAFTVFIGGKQSSDLAIEAKAGNRRDTLPDDKLQEFLSEHNKVFPGSKLAYSGKHKAVFWSNNPFVSGSYACYKPGQWTTISGMEFEPVGNVHFAGEHCSAKFQGFMNGGAETGKLAAEAIIKELALVEK